MGVGESMESDSERGAVSPEVVEVDGAVESVSCRRGRGGVEGMEGGGGGDKGGGDVVGGCGQVEKDR